MPLYEYRCLDCDQPFERRRSMTDDSAVLCPDGHTNVKRLLSVFAAVGSAAGAGSASGSSAPAPKGGGCCGGGCGCR